MTYHEKLKDPRWQRKRLEVLNRDSFTCQNPECRSTTKTLHIHHKRYFYGMEPWDYPNDLLITLCFDCHELEESCKGARFDLITMLCQQGFMNNDFQDLFNIISEKQYTPQQIIKLLHG